MSKEDIKTWQEARRVFDHWSGAAQRPFTDLRQTQLDLAAWQNRNFGAVPPELQALGAAEEIGELCHAILKRAQRILGYGDPQVAGPAIADAIGDALIYLTNLSTTERLDLLTIYERTAAKVIARDWKAQPETGGEQ